MDDPLYPSAAPSRIYASIDGYFLPSDEPEACRLRMQHSALKELCGGQLLHTPLNVQDARILDSGTGEGSWTLDLASSYPSVTVLGIDISSRLFPKSPPSNASFDVQSILTLPTSFSSQFDVVHQRLLMGAFTERQWGSAFTELLSALKPGGWLQLTEVATADVHSPGRPAVSKLYEIYHIVSAHRGLELDPSVLLRSLLKEHDMGNAVELRHQLPCGAWAGTMGIWGREMSIALGRGIMSPFFKLGISEVVADEKEYEQMLFQAADEFDRCPGHHLEYVTIYAQKTLH